MKRAVLFMLAAFGLFVFYQDRTRAWGFKLRPTLDDRERIFHVKFLWRLRVSSGGTRRRWCFVEARNSSRQVEYIRSVRYNGAVTRICHARRI